MRSDRAIAGARMAAGDVDGHRGSGNCWHPAMGCGNNAIFILNRAANLLIALRLNPTFFSEGTLKTLVK